MCPDEEISIRLKSNEIHIFEQPENMNSLNPEKLRKVLKTTMVKQYQRSAADHKLAIPHLVRTPRYLFYYSHYFCDNFVTFH